MPEPSDSRLRLLCTLAIGALLWTPGLLAIVGWMRHWNVYTNLYCTFGFVLFIAITVAALRHG